MTSAAASATAGISPTAAIPSTGVAGSSGAIEHAGAIQSVDLPIGSEASASDLQCAPCNAAPGEDTVSEASAGGNAAATATSAAADVETVNEGGGTASPEATHAAPRLAQQSLMVPPLLALWQRPWLSSHGQWAGLRQSGRVALLGMRRRSGASPSAAKMKSTRCGLTSTWPPRKQLGEVPQS